MSRHLFLLTVTPVQSFIAAARKTQDLYAGSYILSHLSRTVMDRAVNRYGARIMFPNKDIESLPNRVLAVLETGEDPEELRKIGQDLEETIRLELAAMAKHLVQELKLSEKQNKKLLKQLESYFQIYWIFHPLDGLSYPKAYKKIEAAMGSIKNVRTFGQLAETGRKCSITGEHNVLFYRKDKKIIPTACEVPKDTPLKYFAHGEALGGIAFLKRCADKYFNRDDKDKDSQHDEDNKHAQQPKFDSNFPSTSRIALMDTLHELAQKEPAFANIVEEDFDEQDVYRLSNGDSSAQNERAKKVFEQLKKHRISFSPYYAVLVFDGDSMGEWLSGARLKPESSLQEFQDYLSGQLGKFAKIAKGILVPPKGKTVYAGGDDFLGFVNLRYLFPVMKELREKFDQMIDLSQFSNQKLTFSAGVAIAHYTMPL